MELAHLKTTLRTYGSLLSLIRDKLKGICPTAVHENILFLLQFLPLENKCWSFYLVPVMYCVIHTSVLSVSKWSLLFIWRRQVG
jgi:hypothetical protein